MTAGTGSTSAVGWILERSGENVSRAAFLVAMCRAGAAEPVAVGRALDAVLAEQRLLCEMMAALAGGRLRWQRQ